MQHVVACGLLLFAWVGAAAAERARSVDVFERLKEAYGSRNEGEIFYWTLQAAAQKNGTYYRARVGDYYWRGYGVAADPEQAVAWYRSAASLGSVFGMLGLARAHFQGRGTQRSVDAAMHWLAEAADRGIGAAHFELASHFLSNTRAGDPARAEERIARGLEAAAASARGSGRDPRANVNPIGAAYVAAGDAFACPRAAPANMPLAAHFWIRAAGEGYVPAWTRLQALARLPRPPARFCRWWGP